MEPKTEFVTGKVSFFARELLRRRGHSLPNQVWATVLDSMEPNGRFKDLVSRGSDWKELE
jgi:hypothetical protein